jgi:hypothetical protein
MIPRKKHVALPTETNCMKLAKKRYRGILGNNRTKTIDSELVKRCIEHYILF